MNKKFLILPIILILTNCSAPTAFLGPSITVVRTGNVYQAGLSYSSGQIIKKAKESLEKMNEAKKIVYQRVDKLHDKIEIKKFDKVVLNGQADLFFKTIKDNLKKYN